MRKLSLLFFLTLISITVFSQQGLGIYFSGTYNYRIQKENPNYINHEDRVMFGFNTGLYYRLPLSNSFNINTGLEFSQSTIDRYFEYLSTQYGYGLPVVIGFNAKYRYNFIGIPLLLERRFPSKKFVAIDLGVLTKILFNASFTPYEGRSADPRLTINYVKDLPPAANVSYSELKNYHYNLYNADLLLHIKVGIA